MNTADPDWSLLRTFLHIRRGGSLSAAARALGLSHVSVRRHLESLEAALGGVLFTRSPSGLAATDLATRIAPAAEAMESAAAALVRTAAAEASAIGGPVRITASEIVGFEVLPPMLARLRRLHPGLRFELVLSNQSDDLMRRDADIAVRMVRPAQRGLVASRIGTFPVGFFAHEHWVALNGIPTDLPALLASGALIGQDRRHDQRDALARQGLEVQRAQIGFCADSDLAQLAAIRAGLGVGVMAVPLARRDPGLVHVWPERGVDLDMWLVTHPDLRDVPRIRHVLDALKADLRGFLRHKAPGR